MKVEPNGPVRAAGGANSRRGAAAASSRFAVDSGTTSSAATLSGPQPLASVSSVLAVQGANDPTDGRSRGLNRGRSLIERLDEIRIGLLTEGIPRNSLRALAVELRRSRSACADPKLAEVLDEIELRAMVELAKYDDGVSF